MIGRGKCDARGGGEDLIVLGTHILDLMVFFLGDTLMGLAVVGSEGTLSLRFNDFNRSDLKISRLPVAPDDDVAYEILPVAEDRNRNDRGRLYVTL